MIEVIDNNGNKRMAKVMCAFEGNGSLYVLFLIRRDKENINVFCSRVVSNSEGVKVIDSDFSEEEKRWVEEVSKKLFNRESVDNLKSDGVLIVRNIYPSTGVNKFDIEKSYIATISRDDIERIDMYYQFAIDKKREAIKVRKESRKISKEEWGNILVLLLAILMFGICIWLLLDILIK